MARVKVKDRQARLGMKRRFDRAEDFKPVFRWVRSELATANRANFSSFGTASGKPWMPLDDGYARWKLTHAGPAPLMVFSGRLIRSLTVLRGSPNEIDKKSAVFGTDVPYARFHQRGTWKMPARKIIFTPPLFAARTANKAMQHIVHGAMGVSGTPLKGLF